MTLYEMTEDAKRLYELMEAEEIDEQTFRDTLEAMGAEEKLLAYVHVQKQLEAEYDAFYAEQERIEDRMSTLRRRIEPFLSPERLSRSSWLWASIMTTASPRPSSSNPP